MAIPTDFKGPTPVADTTKSFKVFGSTTVGIWALDIDGSLSATTKVVPLGSDIAIIMDAAYTDAAIAVKVRDWLARVDGKVYDAGAGGYKPETTKQVAVVATTCT